MTKDTIVLGYKLTLNEVIVLREEMESLDSGEKTSPFIDQSLFKKHDHWFDMGDLFGFDVTRRNMCCCYPNTAVFGQPITASTPPEMMETQEEVDRSLGNFVPFDRALFKKEPVFGVHCHVHDKTD